MSLKLGTQDISGISQNTKYNAHHLLDFKWTDCIMNDVSWLRADTFSWQSGDVYTSAYNHLVADLSGTTAETETIGSYTVTFYRANDGHKICLADQETTVLNIYNETGIAWYYIVDTTNTQFKLPRTKYGFEGLRNNVGDNINESLPNITGGVGIYNSGNVYGATYWNNNNVQGTSITGAGTANGHVVFDASRSSSTYQNNAPVQERATQMYLYFYVGDYTQSAIEQTAGLNTELFNGKADLNASNFSTQGMSYIASMGMPTNVFHYFAIGASGARYTMPYSGWLHVSGTTNVANGYIYMDNHTAVYNQIIYAPAVNYQIYYGIPVSKGDIVVIGFGGATLQEVRLNRAKGDSLA